MNDQKALPAAAANLVGADRYRQDNDTLRALNLGSGGVPLHGYLNLDAGYADNDAWRAAHPTGGGSGCVQVLAEVWPLPVAWADKYEIVRASHVLEHFGHREVMDVLTDWVRCLAPGGWLKIAVPDLPKCIAAYVANEPLAIGYLYGGQVDERDFHKCAFDEETLRACFETLGLTDVGPWVSEAQDCAALPVSLNLQGRKPGGEPLTVTTEAPAAIAEPITLEVDLTSVQAVMTAPRFGAIDADQAILKAFSSLDISLLRSGGVFWDQGITRVLEQALADGKQWLITVDYDSLFTHADVARLLAVIQSTPEIDALAAYQQRREEDSPLFHLGRGLGEQRIDMAEVLGQETLPVVTAHFGLTVFRASAFAKVEKPWFLAKPDPEGGWGEGRLDADIAFWHRWRECGNSLHVALRVPIGHVEMVTSWPDQRMQRQYQPISEWQASGKPPWAWR